MTETEKMLSDERDFVLATGFPSDENVLRAIIRRLMVESHGNS
jgi:hypothetical protein